MNSIAWPSFRAEILRHYEANRRPKTYGRVRLVLDTLGSLRDERGNPVVATTADLTTDVVTRYIEAHAGDNRNTLRGKVGSLSAICGYALEEGWLDRTPRFKRVRPRKAPPIRERYVSYPDMRRLLAHLRDRPGQGWKGRRDYALASTVALTGVRLSEAIYARVADVSLGGSWMRVYPHVEPLKTEASYREVPLCPPLVEVLREWIPHTGGHWLFPGVRRCGPWSGGNVRDRALGRLKAGAAEVGISWISYHALRHTFATLALTRWRLCLPHVQRILGHTSIRTTEGYLHAAELAELIDASRGISFDLPSRP